MHNKTECFLLMEWLNERPTEVVWKTTHFNFDNVMNGYVSLFHVVCTMNPISCVHVVVLMLLSKQDKYVGFVFNSFVESYICDITSLSRLTHLLVLCYVM